MLERVLEPEVMDTQAEAQEYDAMDFLDVNQNFADCVLKVSAPQKPLTVLDLGTGTARIPILLSHLCPAWQITAVDLARSMLGIAKDNVIKAGRQSQIALEFVDVKCLPYADHSFDGVISNSLLHHLANPAVCLKEIKRVLKPKGFLFLRDLIRPETSTQLQTLVETLGQDYSDHQQQLFADSLHAALTLGEMSELLTVLALSPSPRLYASSDRHWTVERA